MTLFYAKFLALDTKPLLALHEQEKNRPRHLG